ncbi:hypothetical protein QFZ49_005037 [Streptomyces turgidiscabies]|uniref:Uncharacterized protein n=1 Tax=Streptomyces turgidiscabies TaxID=85558 RepID=A0ABU0RSV2_9ACTN|nr:hypothetical protein [Streptomyces turgidiscabies]
MRSGGEVGEAILVLAGPEVFFGRLSRLLSPAPTN